MSLSEGMVGPEGSVSASEPMRRQVARGGLIMLGRHAMVAAVSLVGSTILIRSVPAAAWAAYSVAYFLITFFDNTFGGTILGSLVREHAEPGHAAIRSAVTLMHSIGVLVAIVFLAIGIVGGTTFGMSRDFAACFGSVGVCGFVYSTRSVSVALLERNLAYRPIAVAEIVDQLAFYFVAIPLVAGGLHGNADALAIALAIRGLVPVVLLRRAKPVSLLGAWRSPEVRKLLAFALPALGAASLNGLTGLVAAIALIGRSSTALAYVSTASAIVGYAATGQVILQRVAFPGLSRIRSEAARLSAASTDILRLTSVVLITCVAPIAAFSPWWMGLLFGRPWRAGAQAVVALGAGLLFWNIVLVLFAGLNAAGRPRAVMLVQLLSTLLYLTLAFALTPSNAVLGAPLAFCLSRLAAIPLAAFLSRRSGFCIPVLGQLIALGTGAAWMSAGAYAVAHDALWWLLPLFALAVAWTVWRREDFRSVLSLLAWDARQSG